MSRAPRVVTTKIELRAALAAARLRGARVAFVPTMGALHEGHLALAREARRRVGDDGLVAASIFVNPTQFGPNEDLARYPRDLAGDVAKCGTASVDVVFAPPAAEMYPDGEQTRVRVPGLAGPLCGEHRPVHFEGVATVVAKLYALVAPAIVVFGRKDYQQLKVVERLARDLCFDVEVVGLSTVREPDGLAMSSRNVYLSAEERARALAVPRALAAAARLFASGERRAGAIAESARALVATSGGSVDYVTVADPESLVPARDDATLGERALLAVAVRVGATRLIDNTVLGDEEPPRVSPP